MFPNLFLQKVKKTKKTNLKINKIEGTPILKLAMVKR